MSAVHIPESINRLIEQAPKELFAYEEPDDTEGPAACAPPNMTTSPRSFNNYANQQPEQEDISNTRLDKPDKLA